MLCSAVVVECIFLLNVLADTLSFAWPPKDTFPHHLSETVVISPWQNSISLQLTGIPYLRHLLCQTIVARCCWRAAVGFLPHNLPLNMNYPCKKDRLTITSVGSDVVGLIEYNQTFVCVWLVPAGRKRVSHESSLWFTQCGEWRGRRQTSHHSQIWNPLFHRLRNPGMCLCVQPVCEYSGIELHLDLTPLSGRGIIKARWRRWSICGSFVCTVDIKS